jgi:hypothetical protein
VPDGKEGFIAYFFRLDPDGKIVEHWGGAPASAPLRPCRAASRTTSAGRRRGSANP